jgi:hypothetical protein
MLYQVPYRVVYLLVTTVCKREGDEEWQIVVEAACACARYVVASLLHPCFPISSFLEKNIHVRPKGMEVVYVRTVLYTLASA